MHLREYLEELSIEALQIIARSHKLSVDAKPKRRLVHEIDMKLSDRAYLKRLFGRLDNPEKQALARIALVPEQRPQSYGPIYRVERIHRSHRAKRPLWTLASYGLILAQGTSTTRVHYRLPDDLKPVLTDLVIEDGLKRLEQAKEDAYPIPEQETTILRDLFTLLAQAEKGQIILTQKGMLRKKSEDFLLKTFEPQEEQRWGKDVLLERLNLILSYCYNRELIEAEHSAVDCTSLVMQWLDLSDQEKMQDLLAYCYSTHIQRTNLDVIAFELVRKLSEDELVSFDSLVHIAYGYSSERIDRSGPSRYTRRALAHTLAVLAFLGMVHVRLGQPVPEAVPIAAVSLTPLGRHLLNQKTSALPALSKTEASDELIVQPNYEIMIPKGFDLKLRFQLERFADVIRTDQMVTYQISKASIYRGIESGLDEKAMLTFVEGHSRRSVPQNIVYSISEWAESCGQIQFMNVFLMCTETETLAQELSAHRRIGAFIKGEVSPTALIVDRKQYSKLIRELKNAGYFPKQDIMGEAAPEPKRPYRRFQVQTLARSVETVPQIPVGPVLDPLILFPPTVRGILEDLTDGENGASLADLIPVSKEEAFVQMTRAIREERCVLIDYDAQDGRRVKKIRPLNIFAQEGDTLVRVYCFLHEAQEQLSLTRVRGINVITEEP